MADQDARRRPCLRRPLLASVISQYPFVRSRNADRRSGDRMTLYCAYVGGDAADIYDLEGWLGGGKQWDGYLAYTEGWNPNNWDGLRPTVKTEPPNTSALGGSGRNLI